jgi:hypothetical protein
MNKVRRLRHAHPITIDALTSSSNDADDEKAARRVARAAKAVLTSDIAVLKARMHTPAQAAA